MTDENTSEEIHTPPVQTKYPPPSINAENVLQVQKFCKGNCPGLGSHTFPEDPHFLSCFNYTSSLLNCSSFTGRFRRRYREGISKCEEEFDFVKFCLSVKKEHLSNPENAKAMLKEKNEQRQKKLQELKGSPLWNFKSPIPTPTLEET